MTTFGTIAEDAVRQTRFVQSADPDDLAFKLNSVLIDIFSDDTPQALASLTLAGAGDGHTFVAQLTNAPASSVNGGIVTPGATAVCYLGSDADGLAAARTLALSRAGLPAVADEQLAGASKGTQFMGIMLAGTIRAPT